MRAGPAALRANERTGPARRRIATTGSSRERFPNAGTRSGSQNGRAEPMSAASLRRRPAGACRGRNRGAGAGGAPRALSRRAEPRAARGGARPLDGPVLVLAGAGTGKTAGADRAARPSPRHAAGARRREILAVTFTNKAAREMKERVGAHDRRGGRGHALARHLPLDRRARSCAAMPSWSGCKPEFHHSRHRRPAPPAEAAASRPANIDEKRWPARDARRADRRLEEPRPDARRTCPRARRAPTPTAAGTELYAAVSGRG